MSRRRTPTDLRLLGPAVLAWAVAAAALGLSPAGHLVAAGAPIGVLGAVAAVGPARRLLGRCGLLGPVVLCVLLVAVLQVAAAGHGILRARGGVEHLAAGRAAVTAVAVVTGDPLVLRGRGDRPLVLREATVLVLDARGVRRDTSAPVLLTGDPSIAQPGWRSTVRVRGRLGPTGAADDRVATLSVSGPPQVLESPGAVASAAERLRAGLRSSLDHAPPDARGLLPGLVIGDTSRTPEDLTAAMRATGMTHLTAVSGSNVAVVTGLVLGLCVVLGVPRRWRPVLALVGLAGFVVLARPEPSVVRAAAMGAIGLIGLSRSRRSAGPPVLGAAIVVVLVARPLAGPVVRLRAVVARHPGPAALHPSVGRRHRRPAPRPAGTAGPGARHPGGGAGDDARRWWCCSRARSASSGCSPTCSPHRSYRWRPWPGSRPP